MSAAKRRVSLGVVGEETRRRIRATRADRGLTQKELARLAGLRSIAVNEIENGARRVSVDDLVAIAAVLDVESAYLLGEA